MTNLDSAICIDDVVRKIITENPDDLWMTLCHQQLPGVCDGEIMSIIEIFFGGDCIVVPG